MALLNSGPFVRGTKCHRIVSRTNIFYYKKNYAVGKNICRACAQQNSHYAGDMSLYRVALKNRVPLENVKTFVHREIVLMQGKYFPARRELFCARQIFLRATQSF